MTMKNAISTKSSIEAAFEARLRSWLDDFDAAPDKEAFIQRIKDEVQQFEKEYKQVTRNE